MYYMDLKKSTMINKLMWPNKGPIYQINLNIALYKAIVMY